MVPFPYIIRSSIAPGTVGVPVGLQGLNFRDLPAAIALAKAADWTSPSEWQAGNIIVSDKAPVNVENGGEA